MVDVEKQLIKNVSPIKFDAAKFQSESNALVIPNHSGITANLDAVNKLDDRYGGGGSPEGTAIKSTGEAGGTKFLREDGDSTCSWQSVPGPEGTSVKSTGEAGASKFLREDGDGTSSWQDPIFCQYLKPVMWNQAITTNTNTAGRVYLMRIEVPKKVVADAIIMANFATVAGNITVGIYKPATNSATTPEGASLVASSASTALAGANSYQVIDLSASVTLDPGVYYLAFEFSDATHTFAQISIFAQWSTPYIWVAYYDRGGGYGALTNPCPAVGTSNRALFSFLRCVV